MAWDTSTRAARLPPNWKQLRQAILQRDGYRCTRIEHGERCEATATEVDHIRRGDDHSPANLASLCADHHKAKSQAEASAARWRHRTDRAPQRHPGLA